MIKCAYCPAEAEHDLRLEPTHGESVTGRIAVCSEHVALARIGAARVEATPSNVIPLRSELAEVEADRAAAEDITGTAIEEALDWHRAHPGSDHVDAAYAAVGHAGDLGHSRWPGFVAAVKEVTEASDAFRAAGLEVER
jgi:hypothetical protein